MTNLLIYILLIAILNSILFYGKKLGLSVILFIIPLLIFLYYVLKKENKIKNFKGLLFIIPIVILSSTYFIFNNSFFRLLNIPIIIVLFTLMYLYTIKPVYNIKTIFSNIFTLLVEPLKHVSNIFNLVGSSISSKLKLSTNTKKILKSSIIVLPIVIIVILLLSSADQIFATIFNKLFSYLNNLSLKKTLMDLIKRMIPICLIFFYLGATINFLLYNYEEIKDNNETKKIKIDNYTIKLLLTILNIIYLVFDIIQIKSLILHQISMNISYAEYARQGFFQLMFVSFINLVIILIAKFSATKKDTKDNIYIINMSIILVILTSVIIVSSFIRMYMYESEYGYTLLRLLVYASLITESLLLIPTIKYILDSKFNIVKYYMTILITAYTVLNFINVDYIIAYRNVNRYYEKADIDIYYLENTGTDNIPILVDLYNNTNCQELKETLDYYFKSLDTNMNGFQEFNLSKYNARKKLKKLK